MRAGYALLYNPTWTNVEGQYDNKPPYVNRIGLTPPASTSDPWAGFPGGNPFPTVQNKNTPYPTAGYYESVPLHVRNTYVEQWNLSIQKQVSSSWLLKASYLGNNSIHLWTDQELNPAVYIPGSLCPDSERL